MAETVRDLILKVTVEAPNTAKFDKDAKKMAASLNRVTDAAVKSSKSVAQIAKEMEGTRKKVQDNAVKVGDALSNAASGAFTLARGIALASISGEEDLKKVIEQVAKVQAAFDIFKGTTSLIKSLGAVTKTIGTVSAVATTSQTALAGANTGVATTGAVPAFSMRASLLSLGPIALALSAAVAIYALLNRKKEETIDKTEREKEANEKLERQVRSVDNAYGRLGNAIKDVTKFRIKEGFVGASTALAEIAKDAQVAREEILRLGGTDAQIGNVVRSFQDGADALVRLNKILRTPPKDLLASGAEIASFAAKEFEIEKRAAEFGKELLAVNRQAAQESISVLQNKISLIEQAAEKQIAGEKKAFDLAKQNLDLAKQRGSAFTRSFALLNKAEQQRIRNIAKQVKGEGVASLSVGQFKVAEQNGTVVSLSRVVTWCCLL